MKRLNQSIANERRVLSCASLRSDGWRPFNGGLAAAKRLEKRGLLKQCGTCAMPPYVLFAITDKGRAVIQSEGK